MTVIKYKAQHRQNEKYPMDTSIFIHPFSSKLKSKKDFFQNSNVPNLKCSALWISLKLWEHVMQLQPRRCQNYQVRYLGKKVFLRQKYLSHMAFFSCYFIFTISWLQCRHNARNFIRYLEPATKFALHNTNKNMGLLFKNQGKMFR